MCLVTFKIVTELSSRGGANQQLHFEHLSTTGVLLLLSHPPEFQVSHEVVDVDFVQQDEIADADLVLHFVSIQYITPFAFFSVTKLCT